LSAASTETNTEENGLSRIKRRLLWTCVVAGVVLLLVLLPPLLNVNRLQRRIAASMSASLGRTVHLDQVSLHLLPVPGFTLENLVVSEDPAFGSEPVIRANTVEVTLRPSSLWRRQVEFSSIKFVEPSLNLVRNAQGVWNVQSLLMHAASVNTAPTEQSKAGPAPRFPYIEATGARVNLKIGEEKKPVLSGGGGLRAVAANAAAVACSAGGKTDADGYEYLGPGDGAAGGMAGTRGDDGRGSGGPDGELGGERRWVKQANC